MITAHDAVRGWAHDIIEQRWGKIVDQSPAMPFAAGGYYAPTMGDRLLKTLVSVGPPCDPVGLADWKSETNRWEAEAAAEFGEIAARPLNLDPGYVTQAKLVLATIKDRDHRVYLKDGIFGEITLNYVGKQWTYHRWTYPDYRTPEVFDFATLCRNRLRSHLADTGSFRVGKRD